MKMTYKSLNISELKQSLKCLLSEAKEFEVEFSLDGNAPATLYTGSEVMSLNNILELVEKQGFKVNDINAITSNGKLKNCVGITLNKPFIHDETKEVIEGLFILGDAHDEKFEGSLYSFLICGEKTYPDASKTINFSVDIVSENIETAKAIFFEKIASFKKSKSQNGEEIKFRPLTYEDGEWMEMEPEEDEDEIRFQIEDLTLEKINELFEGIIKENRVVESNENELNVYKISHYYSIDDNKYSVFVETSIGLESFIKTIAAIYFKFEDLVDPSECIDHRHLAIILEKFFDVQDKTQEYRKHASSTCMNNGEWELSKTFKVTEGENELLITQIDLYEARESNCGKDYEKLMKDYLPNSIEFEDEIKNLRDFYPWRTNNEGWVERWDEN